MLIRNWSPSNYWAFMIVGMNILTRIGNVTVMPEDVILGKCEGVTIIAAHLAEKVVKTSEIIRLRDEFGFQRLKEGNYSSSQIDARWTNEIEKNFSQWLMDHMDRLPDPREHIQELFKERTW